MLFVISRGSSDGRRAGVGAGCIRFFRRVVASSLVLCVGPSFRRGRRRVLSCLFAAVIASSRCHSFRCCCRCAGSSCSRRRSFLAFLPTCCRFSRCRFSRWSCCRCAGSSCPGVGPSWPSFPGPEKQARKARQQEKTVLIFHIIIPFCIKNYNFYANMRI